jgi:histidinol-phosphate aminotransferase
MIKKLLRKPVRDLKGTVWGTSLPADFLRLQFSEAPQIFPLVIQAIKGEEKKCNLYPDIGQITRVRGLLAKENKLSWQNVYLAGGVDSLIDIIARTFCDVGDEVLTVSPTYPCYEDAIKFMGGKVVFQKLEKDFSLDLAKFIKKINIKTKIIFLANPNNPTGNILLNIEGIKKILEKAKGLVVVDEEYYGLSDTTFLPLIKKYRNLIILRGFSKTYGIAGLRFGALFADKEIVAYFDKTQGSTQTFEVNRMALAAAQSICLNKKESNEFTRNFKEQKQYFEKELETIKGVSILPTQTSFVLVSLPFPADEFKIKMLEKKIAIKSMSIYKNVPNNLAIMAVPPKEKISFVVSTIKNILENN